MKNLLFGFLGSIAIALSAFAALKAGEGAPVFEARASLAGEPFDYSLHDALADGTVVVYFYPSDMTHGCTAQACAYRDAMAELKR